MDIGGDRGKRFYMTKMGFICATLLSLASRDVLPADEPEISLRNKQRRDSTMSLRYLAPSYSAPQKTDSASKGSPASLFAGAQLIQGPWLCGFGDLGGPAPP